MSIQTEELKKRLKQAMDTCGMRAVELSARTGIPKSSISQYMSGYTKPNGERVYLLSKTLNVSEAWLMGFDVPAQRGSDYSADDGRFPAPKVTEDYTTFPVIGEIAAGYDHIAAENWDGETVDVPNSYLCGRKPAEFFVLLVKGDSMYPAYQDGDKVLILRQSTLNYSGQIGAIIYDNDCATLKRVEYTDGEDWLRLVPVNPGFPPVKIENEGLEHCRVLGIPKLLLREIS